MEAALMQQKTGVIGLPVLECDNGPSSDYSYSTRAFITYTEFAKRHPLGQQKLTQLAADERYARLQDQFKAINHAPPESERLVGWWLMRANEVGNTTADSDLDRYLNDEQVDKIVVTWVYGVEPKTTYRLLENVDIVPVSEMQNCDTKEELLREHWRHRTHAQPVFSGALRSTIRARRVPNPSEPFETAARDAATIHHDVAILLNCLPGICCATGYQTTLLPDHVPVGALNGRGGGFPIRDVVPLRLTAMESPPTVEFAALHARFRRLGTLWNTRLSRALFRFAQSKGRIDFGDRALDLRIALEMVLLGAEHNKQELPGQLHNHFRLRGAWLCGTDVDDRKHLYTQLGKIYAMRSEVAHNGTVSTLKKMEPSQRDELLRSHASVAERIFVALLTQGPPDDWSHVVLGGASTSAARP